MHHTSFGGTLWQRLQLGRMRRQDAQRIPSVTLAGPTSFAPIVRKALELVRRDQDAEAGTRSPPLAHSRSSSASSFSAGMGVGMGGVGGGGAPRGGSTFYVLLILADGQVTATRETEAAIVEASRYPLAIVCLGVGDGPWDEMRRFDEGLPQRAWDNFEFRPFPSPPPHAADGAADGADRAGDEAGLGGGWSRSRGCRR